MKTSPVVILVTPAAETLSTINDNYNEMADAIGSESGVVFQDKKEALDRHGLMFNRYLDMISNQKVN